jgi:alpha-beta hydrolase superfamily lysophospholipase
MEIPVELKTKDGFILKGFLHFPETKKNKYPLIIFVHQFSTTHLLWAKFSQEMNNLGFATFLFDLRGHGLSVIKNGKEVKILQMKEQSLAHFFYIFRKSNEKVDFSKIPDDIADWIRLLKNNERIDENKIVIIGSSLGATSSIPVVLYEKVSAVISISPSSNVIVGKERFEKALKSFENKIIFASSVNDPIGSGKYCERYIKITKNGILFELTGRLHGIQLLPEIKEYIITFLKGFLKD